MTKKGIETARDRERVQFDVALHIRAVIDEAKADYEKRYGRGTWEEDDVEDAVIRLLCEDDPS